MPTDPELVQLRRKYEDQTRLFEQTRGELTTVKGVMLSKDEELQKLRNQVVELNRQVGVLEARLEQLPAVQAELKDTRTQLLQSIQQREADITAAVKDVSQKFDTERAAWAVERGKFTEQIGMLTTENDRLKGQIEGMGGESTSASPDQIASQLARVLEDLQAAAADRTDRPVVGTLRGFDVELKGVVQSTEKTTTLVMPPPGKVDPNQLSTLRMSFAAIPTLRQPVTKEVKTD